MPFIDVVIPNYQYGRYLPDCIESVMAQDHDDIRVLVIDNASTDDSVAIARSFAARDPRIEVRVHETNVGVHASLNEGIDWAQGEYFLLLCSDDLLPPGALKRAVAVMEQNPRIAFAAGAYHAMPDGAALPAPDLSITADWSIRSGDEFIADMCRKLEHCLAPLVRTRIHKRAGYHRPALRYTNDLEVLLRLACFGDVAWTPAYQAIQRLHGANITGDVWRDPVLAVEADLAMYDSFFRNEGGHLAQAGRLHHRARRYLGERAYWSAMSHILRGQRTTGIALLKTARRLAPHSLFMPPLAQLLNTENPFARTMKAISARGGRGRKQPLTPQPPKSSSSVKA